MRSPHVALLVALTACGGEAGAPSPVTSSSSTASAAVAASAAPSAGAPFAELPGPGPASSSEPDEVRERAVLALLEGSGPAAAIPVQATDDGGPLDQGLRGRLTTTTRPRVGARHGPVTVGEGLPEGAVIRVIRGGFTRVRGCYERGLRAHPTLEGRAEVRFSIGATGAVVTPVVTGSLGDPEVLACVRGVVASLSFPPPDKAPVAVSLSYSFTPTP